MVPAPDDKGVVKNAAVHAHRAVQLGIHNGGGADDHTVGQIMVFTALGHLRRQTQIDGVDLRKTVRKRHVAGTDLAVLVLHNGIDGNRIVFEQRPSIDAWLNEAKKDPNADQIGMYLTHNGVVRRTAKAQVRAGEADAKPVTGMHFTYDAAKMEAAVAEAKHMPGIYYVKAWLNEGELAVGDDIMLVLVGGDIRPHVVDALQALVGKLKTECVTELERAQ